LISERLLTAVLRFETRRLLQLKPAVLARLPIPKPDRAYNLYLHIPFCESLCPYCSFHRFVCQENLIRRYFENLHAEIRLIAEAGYRFQSMYIGGGTPTILINELVKTIDLARDLLGVREVSCETNPNHLIPEIMSQLEGKVQRLSVGIQSFDERLLRQMQRYDRYGSGEENLRRIQDAAKYFPTLNVDMIFNFPSQTPAILREDIRKIIASGTNQATFYPLMTSPAVARSMRNSVGQVTYETEANFYRIVLNEIAPYFDVKSAWTFARHGGNMIDEYIVDYEDYIGAGSGAFSYIDGTLYVNTFSLNEYEKAVHAGKMPISEMIHFRKHDRMRYRFMMNLFGLELDKTRFRQSFQTSVEQGLWLETAFMRLVGGYDQDDSRTITLTEKGRYLLVAMMREFFSGMDGVREQERAALPPEEQAFIIHDRPLWNPTGSND
jgi:menaquinone C8-methyltransferase